MRSHVRDWVMYGSRIIGDGDREGSWCLATTAYGSLSELFMNVFISLCEIQLFLPKDRAMQCCMIIAVW